MASAKLIFQLHAIRAWRPLAPWPFSRQSTYGVSRSPTFAAPMTEGRPEEGHEGSGPLGSANGERPPDDENGVGDPACWLDLVCFECGRLGGHVPGCSSGAKAAEAQAPLSSPP